VYSPYIPRSYTYSAYALLARERVAAFFAVPTVAFLAAVVFLTVVAFLTVLAVAFLVVVTFLAEVAFFTVEAAETVARGEAAFFAAGFFSSVLAVPF
jgi:hypothetical protein